MGEDVEESTNGKEVGNVVSYDSDDDAEETANESRDVKAGGRGYLRDSSNRKQIVGDNATKQELSSHKKSIDEVVDTKESADAVILSSGDGKDENIKNRTKMTANHTDANFDDIDESIEKKSSSSPAIKESDAAEDSTDATKNFDVNENATKVDIIEESSDAEKNATLESSTAGKKSVASEGADDDDSDDEKVAVDVKSKMGGGAKEAVDATKIIGSSALEKEYDNCIVGAGLSGSVIAENYASHFGQSSLIIEKRDHIAGNCFDYIDEETGIRVSLFGAHLFHTRHERVWEYVQKFSEWVPYEHKVLGMVNGKLVPIPVTIDTVNILFDMDIKTTEEMDEFMKKERVPLVNKRGKPREAVNSEEVALANVGQRLYDLIFKPYTFKQWAKYPGACEIIR
jgi:hypothetical protein